MHTHGHLSPRVLPASRIGALYYLFFFFSAGSFAPFLYVYFAELGLSGQQIGWLASLAPLSTLLLATPISALADRRGWRVRLVLLAMAGHAAILFFLQFPTTFGGIALLILPLAVLASPGISIADGLIARTARRQRLNYGGMRLWGSIGFATSALLFGAIWQRLGFKPMFLTGSLLFLPLLWISRKLEEGPIRKEQKGKPVGVLFRDTGLAMLLTAAFLAGISNSLSLTFEGIYVRSIGGGNFVIGVMIAFAAFAELPTMFYSRRLIQRLRGANTVLLAYGLTASAYLGYIVVAEPSLLPLFSILKGLGFGLSFTSTVHLLTERTPDEWASTAQSLLTVGLMGLAPLIAAPLGGRIHDVVSPTAVFGLGVLALGLAALILRLASVFGKLE